MKSIFLYTLLFACSSILLFSQETIDFEDLYPGVDTFNNGSAANGRFSAGSIWLPNDYSAEFDAWTGWAISSKNDTTSAGFVNQYSAIPGTGADSTNTYAVGYAFDPIVIHIQDAAGPAEVGSLYVTNNTYPYISMRDGDAFSKKFGGVSGDDPDFFLLTIRAYQDGVLSSDSVDFYLADFRSDSSENDYIVNTWTEVDLSILGDVDSLQFALTSSDVGAFGMNTPAYFSVDQITLNSSTTSTNQFDLTGIRIYPNPTADWLYIDNESGLQFEQLTLINGNGQVIWQKQLPTGSVDMSTLPSGPYFMHMKRNDGQRTIPLMKK